MCSTDVFGYQNDKFPFHFLPECFIKDSCVSVASYSYINFVCKLGMVKFLVLVLPALAVYQCNAFSDVCFQPRERGSYACSSYSVRYFYKVQESRCERFRYRGCNGTSNNFISFSSCMAACIRSKLKI